LFLRIGNDFFLLVDLLRYNDELLNSFKSFEQYTRERDERLKLAHNMPTFNNININGTDEPSLINFDDEPVQITT